MVVNIRRFAMQFGPLLILYKFNRLLFAILIAMIVSTIVIPLAVRIGDDTTNVQHQLQYQ